MSQKLIPYQFNQTPFASPLHFQQVQRVESDPFNSICHYYHNDHLYSKTNHYLNKSTFVKTYYFQFNSCPSRLRIIIQPDGSQVLKLGMQVHTTECLVDTDISIRMNIILQDAKAQAQELYNQSRGTRSAADIAATVTRAMNDYYRKNREGITPMVVENQVKGWLKECISTCAPGILNYM